MEIRDLIENRTERKQFPYQVFLVRKKRLRLLRLVFPILLETFSRRLHNQLRSNDEINDLLHVVYLDSSVSL